MRWCRCRQISVSHAGDIERTNIHVHTHNVPFYIETLRCSILLHCILPVAACQGWCLPCVYCGKSDSCPLGLAPACSWLLFTVRSPDSAAQPATLCVIGEGGSNEPRSAELSRLGVSRASPPTTHISFLPSDHSSLFVKPFSFFHLSPQNEPAFLPRTRNRTREEGIRSNPIHFPHRLPLALF